MPGIRWFWPAWSAWRWQFVAATSLLDPVTEGRQRLDQVPLHGVVPVVEVGMTLADAGVEQEQAAVAGAEEMGDDDAFLAGPRLVGRERERPGVERQDLPEIVVSQAATRVARSAGSPRGSDLRRQSSSARKMCAAVQALQIGRLVSRSPRGIGTRRSG